VHLFNVGLYLLNDREHERLFVDLSRTTTLEGALALLRLRAARTPSGAWILGAGWNQGAWGEARMPTAGVLTRAAPSHPVYLARSDGHAGWVNANAAVLAGAPIGTGLLLERANEAFTAVVPALADSDVVSAYELAAGALAARGVAEVYDAGVLAPPGVVALNADIGRYVRLLQRADSLHALPIRVNLMVPAPSAYAESLLAAPGRRWSLSPRLRISHLKLFADGALGSRGAALTHPYADDPTTRGVPRMTAAEIATLAGRALDAGLGVATHAIGDEAVKRTLDAYEEVIRVRPRLDPARLRIEHFSYAREPDFARAVRLGVVLSIQTNFNSSPDDRPPFGAVRVGALNEPRVYAWDRLRRAGARLAEGSDYFARPLEPFAGFHAALTRRYAIGADRPDGEGRAMAYQMQARRFPPSGAVSEPVLRAGAPADFVVLSADPLTVPIAEIPRIVVLATVNRGRLVWATPEFRRGLPPGWP
jgi:predicted amidohydrolase YtcJ